MVNKKSHTQRSKSKSNSEEIGSAQECNVESDAGACDEVDGMGKAAETVDHPGVATTPGGKRKAKPVRSSNRVPKKVKKEISPPTSPVKKQAKLKSTTPEAKRTSGRKWEMWSKEDQQLFYDGLFEFGKDFDSIYRYISTRQKKRGCIPEMLKNKDQIRHFYYRAWHKISKWIKFKEGIKKSMQEVYALINYGEFRKRVPGGLDPKLGEKLNELFHTGVTNVKVKGKLHKLRTPVCRALKKINNIEEPKEEDIALQLPDEIVVELRPRTNRDWAHVHAMCQNPRLRMHVKPDRRLSSVINYAQRKWRQPTSHIREILDLAPISSTRLRLSPMGDITPISLRINPPNKRIDIGLDVVKANLREISTDQLRKYGERKKKQKLISDEQTTTQEDLVIEYPEHQVQMDPVPDWKPADLMKETVEREPLPEIPDHCAIQSLEMEHARSYEPHDAENEAARVESSSEELVNLGGFCANTVECMDAENVELTQEELANLEEKFRSGWTDSDAHEITVAEIYLILNEPEKVYLQYEFVEDNANMRTPSIEAAGDCGAKTKFASAMEKLLMVARTQFINLAKLNKQAQLMSSGVQCTCGAQNDGSPSAASRVFHNCSPGTPKQAPRRGASPAQGQRIQRRGSNAKSKKELDMNATAEVAPAAPPPPPPPQLAVIAPAPATEFRVPERPLAARPLVAQPVPLRPLAPDIGTSGLFTSRNLFQTLDAATKRTIAPIARNKMRLKQIRPRPFLAKPSAARQLVSLTMAPGGDHVQKAFMPGMPGVVARHIGPSVQAVTINNGATVTETPAVVGVKPTDLDRLMANVVSINTGTPDFDTTQTTSIATPVPSSVSSESTVNTVSTVPTVATVSTVPTVATVSTVPTVATVSTVPTVATVSTVPAVPAVVHPPPPSTDETSQYSISDILDISLPSPDPGIVDSDRFIDMALNNNPTFSQYLTDRPLDAAIPSSSTPAQSPIKLPDFFLNSESGDISLGSFLDSPVKRDVTLSAPPPSSLFNDNSRDSITNKFESQVESTLQYMMNENSMEYMSKFADLAAQITATADSDSQKNDHVT